MQLANQCCQAASASQAVQQYDDFSLLIGKIFRGAPISTVTKRAT